MSWEVFVRGMEMSCSIISKAVIDLQVASKLIIIVG